MSAEIQSIHFPNQAVSILVMEKDAIDDSFTEYLISNELNELNQLTNKKRSIEFLTIRKLRTLAGISSPIYYEKSGRPFLAPELNMALSISHSKNYCAISYGKQSMGLDIEEIDERIERISSRFLNDSEFVFIGNHRQLDLTKIWTMKEAMFKLNPRKGIDFKTELIIEKQEGSSFKGKMLTDQGWANVLIESTQHKTLVITTCSMCSQS